MVIITIVGKVMIGQRCLGIFRSLCTAEGKLAYEEFEMLYRNVSREFPEELEYISLEGLKDKDLLAALEKRGKIRFLSCNIMA